VKFNVDISVDSNVQLVKGERLLIATDLVAEAVLLQVYNNASGLLGTGQLFVRAKDFIGIKVCLHLLSS
jgi:hypothetical protein